MIRFQTFIRFLATGLISVVLTSAGLAEDLEFHFLDVDQGDATLIKCPNGLTVLVDCGSLRSSTTIEDRVREYLVEQLAIPQVDVLVITHPDTDHYRLLPEVLEGIEVGLLLHVGDPDEHDVNDVDTWIESISNRQVLDVDDADPQDQPSPLFDSGEVRFHVLAANVPASDSPKNARSIVLRVDFNEFEAILTGDATFDTEEHIAARYDTEFLDVELLKIGHHGSSTTSTSADWAQRLRPEVAVVSAGFDNPFEHPRKTVLDRVAQFTDDNAPPHFMRWGVSSGGRMVLRTRRNYPEAIFNTASNGNIVVTTNGSEFSLRYGGSSRLAGEMQLAAIPGQPLDEAPEPLVAGAPTVRRRATAQPVTPSRPGIEATAAGAPAGPPIAVGTNVVVDTAARQVAGRFQGYTPAGWLIIREADDTTYIQSDTLIIRIPEPGE